MSYFLEPMQGFHMNDEQDAADDPGDPADPPGPGHGPGGGGRGGDDDDDKDGKQLGGDGAAGSGAGSSGDAAGGGIGGGGGSGGGGGESRSQKGPRPDDVLLMRQYLQSSLKLRSYISIPVEVGGGGTEARFFQLLSKEGRAIHVSTFEDEGEPQQFLYRISVQPLEVWRSICEEPDQLGSFAETFITEDPVDIDALSLCSADPASRGLWLEWEPGISDVEGCVNLSKPTPIAPTAHLSSSDIPVLCLLDALESDGWAPHAGRVFHERGSKKQYDCRQLPRQRRYLQCLLLLPTLLKAGVVGFPSGLSAAWYELLARVQKQMPANLSAKECKRQLGLLQGGPDLLTLALQSRQPTLPAAKKPRLDPPRVATDPDIVGDDAPTGAPAHVAGPSGMVAGEPSDDEFAADVPADEVVQAFPATIMDCQVRRVPGVHRAHWNYNDRLAVQCPAHGTCSRSRSVELDANIWGAQAAALYLGTWLHAANRMSAEEHRAYRPTRSDIQVYVDLPKQDGV